MVMKERAVRALEDRCPSGSCSVIICINTYDLNVKSIWILLLKVVSVTFSHVGMLAKMI